MNDKSFTSWHANSDWLITSVATPFFEAIAKLCRVPVLLTFFGRIDID